MKYEESLINVNNKFCENDSMYSLVLLSAEGLTIIEIIDREDNAEELLPMVTPRCAPPQAITGWSDHATSQMQKRGIGADYAQSVFSCRRRNLE